MQFEESLMELEQKIEELREFSKTRDIDMSRELAELERKAQVLREKTYNELSPWQVVQIMRHPERPHTLDYVDSIFEDFLEVHGDRAFADDKAIIAGFGKMEGRKIGILGSQKGGDTKENILRNFGMAQPEGYRKALRFMRLCEKFRIPILTMVDTSGAYPGIEGEERGVAEAIARNLSEMSRFQVPIVVVVIGEGGSGGALGIGVGDRVLMMQNAYYSVISPEGCAAILWHDRAEAEQASAAMKGTAEDLQELGIIDEIVKEPVGGAHRDFAATAQTLKNRLIYHFDELLAMNTDDLLEKRYQKYRAMGRFTEA